MKTFWKCKKKQVRGHTKLLGKIDDWSDIDLKNAKIDIRRCNCGCINGKTEKTKMKKFRQPGNKFNYW